MATERTRARVRIALLSVVASLAACSGCAPRAAAAEAWWVPVAFRGERVTAVAVAGDRLLVRTAQGVAQSADGGRTWTPTPTALPSPPAGLSAQVVSGRDRWALRGSDGRVLHAPPGAPLAPDPGAPALGACARLLAAPAARPGAVVAAACDGSVWRRSAAGVWNTALLLLPQGIPGGGAPAVTGLAAFTQPITSAVYLGTDGYGVLLSSDGGDDWIRADPGLPGNVRGLAADSPGKALYAATDDGVWRHLLRPLPAPPAYADAALTGRQLGTGAITVAAVLVSWLSLLLSLRVRRRAPRHSGRLR